MTNEAPSPLVDVPWLEAHQHDPSVRIVDVRWYLGRPGDGLKAYQQAHIPGASYIDLDHALASPPGSGPGRHPLPTADTFARALASIGATPSTTIIAYDDMGGAIAARLWWLSRYFAAPQTRVLNGGLQAWIARSLPLTSTPPSITPTPPMPLTPGHIGVVNKNEVNRLRLDPSVVILDARARPRYEGLEEPIDPRAGHIPGARSAPFVENLLTPAGEMLPREALERRYAALGALNAPQIIASCGSGVTACHTLLALALAGRADALLYEGSWSDWSADPNLPLTTGPNP